MGGSRREAIETTHQSNLVVPLVLAIILDGVPESGVIGLGILEGDTVNEHGGKLARVFLVLGFAVCVWIIVLEHAGAG